MRRLALVALILLALPSAVAAQPTGGTAILIVAEARQTPPTSASNNLLLARLGGRVVVYEAGAGTSVLGTIAVPRGPEDVASTFDAKRVLVASPAAGAVTLLDARRHAVLKVFRRISNPADVEISPDGRRGYVVEKGRGRLLVLDLVLLRVAGKVAVGARPNRLDVSDNVAWVAHESPARALTVVDVARLARPRVAGRLGAAGPVRTLLHVPDSAWLLVTYWHSPLVAKLDAGLRRVVFTRRLGGTVTALGVDWSSTRVWAARSGGRVAVLSSRTGKVLKTIRTGGPVSEIRSYGSFMALRIPRGIRIVVAPTVRPDHTIPVHAAGFDVAAI
jgi:DNA-binding beta-propeller fold protein YncE